MSGVAARIVHMFEDGNGRGATPATTDVAAFIDHLAWLSTGVSDPERVALIGVLESLKAAAGAAQARMTAAFEVSQRDAQRAAGVPTARVGQGIAAQVGLARRESPARAARFTGWSKVLVEELPATFAALERGATSEWRAMIVARETIWLSREHRAVVDAALAGRLGRLGDRQVEVETKRLAYRLDPYGFLARSRTAERDRRVSLRPAPDTMARLTALLPAAQGVAAYAALTRAADTARAGGDPRGRGQVMADTLVQRLTGQDTADGVGVEIELIMTDHTLHGPDRPHSPHSTHSTHSPEGAADPDGPAGAADPAGAAGPAGGQEPGYLVGYGPVPAGLARDLAASTDQAQVWVRRLCTDPCTGQLAGMDTRRRRFTTLIRRAVIIRDQICRTPWCGAPIRHIDHAQPATDAGPTNYSNAQGLCEACNYAKTAHSWTTEPGPSGASNSVITTTPTGHTHTTRPPDLPGTNPESASRQRAGPERAPVASSHAA